MSKLGVVEDTLFVPMLGRIYASEHCPQILYDKKALELKNKLPLDLIKQNKQNQYTLLASASRSANMDRFILYVYLLNLPGSDGVWQPGWWQNVQGSAALLCGKLKKGIHR